MEDYDQSGDLIPLEECPGQTYDAAYSVEARVGGGAFNCVLLCQPKTKADEGKVIVKVFHKYIRSQRVQTTYSRELECLRMIKGLLFLQQMVDHLESNIQCYIISDYVGSCSLSRLVSHNVGGLPPCHVQFYLTEVNAALATLHKIGVQHRNLHPDNVVLDSQGHIVLCDLAGLQHFDRQPMHFAAPELFRNEPYTECCDWWSYGVMAHYIFTGKLPFAGTLQRWQDVARAVQFECYLGDRCSNNNNSTTNSTCNYYNHNSATVNEDTCNDSSQVSISKVNVKNVDNCGEDIVNPNDVNFTERENICNRNTDSTCIFLNNDTKVTSNVSGKSSYNNGRKNYLNGNKSRKVVLNEENTTDATSNPHFPPPTTSTKRVVSPSTDTIVSPSTDTIVSPSTDTIVSPSTDTILSPSTKRIVPPIMFSLFSPPQVKQYMSEDLESLVTQLLKKDRRNRLGSEGTHHVRSHPYFRLTDWQKADTRSLPPPLVPETYFNGHLEPVNLDSKPLNPYRC